MILIKRNAILIITLFIITICIPQINITNYPQSTITSKFLVFSYFCILYLITSTFLLINFKKQNIALSRLDIVFIVLVIYMSINRYLLQQDYSFSIRYIELIGLSFIYLVIRSFNIKKILWLLLAIVISGIIQAIYGNLQLLGYYSSNHSGFKLTGSFFNPGPYAGFLVSVFPVALGLYLFKEKVINYVFFDTKTKSYSWLNAFIKYVFEYTPLIGVVSIILVIPATQSRASWLAILMSSSLLLELRYQVIKKGLKQLTRIKKTIFIVCSFLIIGVSLFKVYHLKQGSSDGRLFIWKVSSEIIKDNPVFGVGFDRFKAHYMNYQARYFFEYGETEEALVTDNTYYVFNAFIQFITENGIIGFLLLILVLYVIIKTSTVKENNNLSTLVKISLLSVGVFAFFSYPMEILPIKLIVVVLIASLAKLDQNRMGFSRNFKVNSLILPILKTLMLTGALVIAVFSFNYINTLNNSFINWQLALSSYQYGDYESAIQEYEEAYPELKNNGEFLMNYGKALSIYKQDKKGIKTLEQAKRYLNTTIIETALGDAYKNIKQYKEAENEYKHAFNMIPCRFYPLYLLAKLYEESNQKEKAVAMAKIILNKEVKIPSTAIKEMQVEMKNIITNYNKE